MRDTKRKIRVGIIGCGVIGSFIAKSLEKKELFSFYKITALSDENKLNALKLNSILLHKAKILEQDALIDKVDLVIEAASAKVSYKVAKKSLENKKDVLCMSVGGLVDGFSELLKLANKYKSHLYLPSGAICGIDGLKGAGIKKIKSVTITTSKPPKGLKGAPYLVKKGIDVEIIKGETVIFEGSAKCAIKYFPQNVNVAATLSLAGIGAKKTKVKVITSPNFTKNSHKVEIEGDFGKITTETINLPSKENPKTSALAMYSAVAKLKEIAGFVNIGT